MVMMMAQVVMMTMKVMSQVMVVVGCENGNRGCYRSWNCTVVVGTAAIVCGTVTVGTRGIVVVRTTRLANVVVMVVMG